MSQWKALRNSRTYYLVVYISVVHLKLDVKFEIIPQYSSSNICRHIISMTDEIYNIEECKSSHYLAWPIWASAYLIPSENNLW